MNCWLLAGQPGPKNYKTDSTKAGNCPTTTATPTFERESFFSLNHILSFIIWCVPIPGFPLLVFLELGWPARGRGPEKKLKLFSNFFEKMMKNLFQYIPTSSWGNSISRITNMTFLMKLQYSKKLTCNKFEISDFLNF